MVGAGSSAGARPIVGVLALQGNFAAHSNRLAEMGVTACEIRTPEELSGVDALVIPGGETTTLLHFFDTGTMETEIGEFAASGKPIFGTCAGAILLARKVTGPSQRSLGLIDIAIERNGYGRQVDSFITREPCSVLDSALDPTHINEPLEMVFIRAPIIRSVGPRVRVLQELRGHPVLVRQDRILAATFHPELTSDPRLHAYFVSMIGQDH